MVLSTKPANDVTREIEGEVYISWTHVQEMRRRECDLIMSDIARIGRDYDGKDDHPARSALEQVRQEIGAVLYVQWSKPSPGVTRALLAPTPLWETVWRKIRWFLRHPLRGRET